MNASQRRVVRRHTLGLLRASARVNAYVFGEWRLGRVVANTHDASCVRIAFDEGGSSWVALSRLRVLPETAVREVS